MIDCKGVEPQVKIRTRWPTVRRYRAVEPKVQNGRMETGPTVTIAW